MAYTISNPDGSTLVLLGDRKIDQSTTSLTLVGKNWAGYGEYINNNFIKLLASHASSSNNPPRSPLKGQLWYDTTAKRLKVYDESFKPVTGAIISGSLPSGLTSGDMWFDTANEQLKVFSNNALYLVGPLFPVNVGQLGFDLPPLIIKDLDNSAKDVALLKNYGETLGYMSNQQFFISTSSNYSYITATTTATVKGLTILGDINYTGKITDRYLSINVDFDTMFTTSVVDNRNITDQIHFDAQNVAIRKVLKACFPVNESTGTVTFNSSVESGIPVGSEARVLCKFSLPAPGGYQVRRFVAIGGTNKWDVVTISTGTMTNVVETIYQGSF